MNKYVIIRSDTKSISFPISKKEALKRLQQYNKDGISTYLVYRNSNDISPSLYSSKFK